MLGLLKKMFGVKPAETITEVPYKVEVATALSEPPATVVVVEGAGVVQITPVVAQPAKSAPKKPQAAKKPAVPKTAKPKAPPKPKAKPTA